MPIGVYVRTAECNAKNSLAKFGHLVSSGTRAKMSNAMKGRRLSDEHKRKISIGKMGNIPWSKGLTKETHPSLAMMSQKKRGQTFTEEHKLKISQSEKGKQIPIEVRAKISANHCHQVGEANSSWRGGISFLPYPPIFNRELKDAIRVRDNYTCRICDTHENGRRLTCHHIDYNKDNCDPINLLAVCCGCNGKLNKDREFWSWFLPHIQVDLKGGKNNMIRKGGIRQ